VKANTEALFMTLRGEQKLFKEAQKIAKQFIGSEGVTDIEFGLKHQEGKLTNKISLRFKVNEKKSEKKLKRSEILPKKVGIFITDVLSDKIVQHEPRIENSRNVVRPLLGGVQIQSGIRNSDDDWATMGFFYPIKNYVFGFTNYHVLYGGASPDYVLKHYVGKLPVFQNLNRENNQIGISANLFSFELDYATFVLKAPIDQVQSINALNGLLTSYAYPRVCGSVIKSGASTGVTFGIIDARSCLNPSELSIHIDPQYPNHNNTVSDYGDSGSVWILNDDSNIPKPVALHYGGDETKQWAKAKTLTSIFASIRNKIQNQNSII